MELIVTTDGNQLLEVHSRARCRRSWLDERGFASDYACCVHAPSAHPLNREPLRWNARRAIMERACLHGILHPDPDDLRVRYGFDDGVHACDGCCVLGG